MSVRKATVQRKTNETQITCTLVLDGTGQVNVSTGIGFLDHMLHALAKHARFDLDLTCQGDLHVDDHHTAEDSALVIGQAIDEALGDRKGIERFGDAHAPLDEALARAVVDLSGRPSAIVNLGLDRDMIGTISTEMLSHVLVSLAMASRMTLHVDVLRGDNNHHKCESAYKAVARALRSAVRITGQDIPSTKGTLG